MKYLENSHKLLRIDFIRFCFVGAIGFVVNFLLLTLLYKMLQMPLFVAQLIAGEIALFGNFIMHHNWTYKHKKIKKTIGNLLWQFHVTSWLAIVGTAVIVSAGVRFVHLHYFVALSVGAIVALFWNFCWSKYIIWHHHDHSLSVAEGDL